MDLDENGILALRAMQALEEDGWRRDFPVPLIVKEAADLVGIKYDASDHDFSGTVEDGLWQLIKTGLATDARVPLGAASAVISFRLGVEDRVAELLSKSADWLDGARLRPSTLAERSK